MAHSAQRVQYTKEDGSSTERVLILDSNDTVLALDVTDLTEEQRRIVEEENAKHQESIKEAIKALRSMKDRLAPYGIEPKWRSFKRSGLKSL